MVTQSSTSCLVQCSCIVEDQLLQAAILIDRYGNEFTTPDCTFNDICNAIPKHYFDNACKRSVVWNIHVAYVACAQNYA